MGPPDLLDSLMQRSNTEDPAAEDLEHLNSSATEVCFISDQSVSACSIDACIVISDNAHPQAQLL